MKKNGKNRLLQLLCGTHGAFDCISRRAAQEMQRNYSDTRTVLVLPYLDEAFIKRKKIDGYDEEPFFPPIEKTPLRFAISAANRYRVSCAEHVIAYVNRDFGGAFDALRYAVKQKKQIHLLCSEFSTPLLPTLGSLSGKSPRGVDDVASYI